MIVGSHQSTVEWKGSWQSQGAMKQCARTDLSLPMLLCSRAGVAWASRRKGATPHLGRIVGTEREESGRPRTAVFCGRSACPAGVQGRAGQDSETWKHSSSPHDCHLFIPPHPPEHIHTSRCPPTRELLAALVIITEHMRHRYSDLVGKRAKGRLQRGRLAEHAAGQVGRLALCTDHLALDWALQRLPLGDWHKRRPESHTDGCCIVHLSGQRPHCSRAGKWECAC